MANAMPWFKFFPAHWATDVALSKCSPATRGIWMDLLCSMYADGDKGVVSGTIDQLARMTRCTPQEIRVAVDELKNSDTADVTECNGVVTLENRKMKREFKTRNSTKTRVQKHRNAVVTGDVTPNVTPCNAIEVEEDIDKETTEKQKESCAEVQKTAPPAPTATPEEILMEFPVVGTNGTRWGLTKKLHSVWVKAYPAVNIDEELGKALAWCESNPRKQKTPSGMPRFLNDWIKHEQNNASNRGGYANSRAAPAPAPSLMPDGKKVEFRKFEAPGGNKT